MTYDAVVLAGGAARRLGGQDKPGLDVGGRTLLEVVLAAVPDAGRVVVVGPPRPLPPHVHQVREEPPGAGPAAALAAGVQAVSAEYVAVLAADQPLLTAHVVAELLRRAIEADGAVLLDDAGYEQVLTSVWRRAALLAAVARGVPPGTSVRRLLADLRRVQVPLQAVGLTTWFDCDTPDDVARARRA